MMGAPGSGKGTQAVKIARRYGIAQISTGELLRQAAGTELGKLAAAYMKNGQLVPDEVIIGLVRERLSAADCANGFILDGFPRTVKQAEQLGLLMQERGERIDCVVNIAVPSAELIERAVGRRICKSCGATYHIKYKPSKAAGVCDECGGELYQRSDDTAETMRNRLKVYEESTRPLTEYYKVQGKYKEVDGRQSIEKVTEDLEKELTSVKG